MNETRKRARYTLEFKMEAGTPGQRRTGSIRDRLKGAQATNL